MNSGDIVKFKHKKDFTKHLYIVIQRAQELLKIRRIGTNETYVVSIYFVDILPKTDELYTQIVVKELLLG